MYRDYTLARVSICRADGIGDAWEARKISQSRLFASGTSAARNRRRFEGYFLLPIRIVPGLIEPIFAMSIGGNCGHFRQR